MTAEQWSRLEDLFERGSGQAPPVQEQILAECADDPEVQAELRLLWEHENAVEPEFLAHPRRLVQGLASPRALLSAGDVIAGRFTILEVIGHGGMGEVFRARDERLRRIVAIKVLRSRLASDAAYRRRLEQEARAVSSLSHPAICALHDLGSDGDLLFLVMEYVPGESLDVRLQRGPIPEREAIGIVQSICEGLQHAHASGLVHRDLKPANIMLTPHGVKLLDFGIACRMGDTDAAETGRMIAGTPAYMSPEQSAGKPVDARSDIYSVGLLLREMLPESKRPRLRRIVARCVEQDPARRFGTAGELARALQTEARMQPVRKWGMVAVAGVVLGTLGFWRMQGETPQPEEPHLRVLTAYRGTEYAPTLSPDGKSVAFLWNGEENNYDLYVRPIDADQPKRLTTDAAPEKSPRWSPDGRWIAFERNGKAMLIPASGGEERFVVSLDHVNALDCDVRLAWSADSRRLIFAKESASGKAVTLHDIEIVTGKIRELVEVSQGGQTQSCPELSPDGRKLAFRSVDSGHFLSRLALLNDDGQVSSVRKIPWVDGWSHAWTADSRDLIFSRRLPGVGFLFRTGASEPNTPQRLLFGEEGMYPVISRTGGRLVYMRRRLDTDVWRADLERATQSGKLQGERFLSSSQPDKYPEYSPDGSRIAFLSDRQGRTDVWTCAADGSDLKRLGVSDVRDAPPRWSPDGRYLVYGHSGDIYRVAASGGLEPELLTRGEMVDTAPSYSRDGQWIYFTSHRSGSAEIWRMPSGGGPAERITQEGAYMALESWDGRELYLLRTDKDKHRLHVMPVGGGSMREISFVPVRPTLWVSPKGLYFIAATASDEPPVLSFFDSGTRKVRPILRMPFKQRGLATGLSLTPDERHILYSSYELQADLMLVENYR